MFSLLFALLAPVHAASFLAVIDAGHGGTDFGAVQKQGSTQISEKEITLAIAKQTAEALKKLGIQSILTRQEDKVVLLDERTAIANKKSKAFRDAVFVSIHVNSTNEPTSRGFETYVFNATTNDAAKHLADIENGSHRVSQKGVLDLIFSDLSASANYADSVRLACATQETVMHEFKQHSIDVRDRGVRHGLFYVLMGSRIPGILIEVGFSSNPAEAARLVSTDYQKTIARGIARGIVTFKRLKSSPGRISGIQKTNCLK